MSDGQGRTEMQGMPGDEDLDALRSPIVAAWDAGRLLNVLAFHMQQDWLLSGQLGQQERVSQAFDDLVLAARELFPTVAAQDDLKTRLCQWHEGRSEYIQSEQHDELLLEANDEIEEEADQEGSDVRGIARRKVEKLVASVRYEVGKARNLIERSLEERPLKAFRLAEAIDQIARPQDAFVDMYLAAGSGTNRSAGSAESTAGEELTVGAEQADDEELTVGAEPADDEEQADDEEPTFGAEPADDEEQADDEEPTFGAEPVEKGYWVRGPRKRKSPAWHLPRHAVDHTTRKPADRQIREIGQRWAQLELPVEDLNSLEGFEPVALAARLSANGRHALSCNAAKLICPVDPDKPPTHPVRVVHEPKLKPIQRKIMGVLRNAKRRMTTEQILHSLDKDNCSHSIGGFKNCLSELVRHGLLTNRRDVEPPGYGLPEWDQT